MKEKIITARSLVSRTFRTKRQHSNKRAYIKCCIAYIWQCLIKGQETFIIEFNGKYVRSPLKRLKDLVEYWLDKEDNYKPIFVKITNAPDEYDLDRFLGFSGLKIHGEMLYPVETIYTIGKV